jgi:hypothetical protein
MMNLEEFGKTLNFCLGFINIEATNEQVHTLFQLNRLGPRRMGLIRGVLLLPQILLRQFESGRPAAPRQNVAQTRYLSYLNS